MNEVSVGPYVTESNAEVDVQSEEIPADFPKNKVFELKSCVNKKKASETVLKRSMNKSTVSRLLITPKSLILLNWHFNHVMQVIR